MKKLLSYLFVLFLVLYCAESTKPSDDPPTETNGLENLAFGTEGTFDLITWNLETFPKSFTTTIDYAAEAIFYLSPDVMAFQEIESRNYFTNLVDRVNELDSLHIWEGYRSGGSSTWMELAYLVKTDAFTNIQTPYEIYGSYGSAFPREPYILELDFNGSHLVLINNHLKCCGDGIIEPGNTGDEEYRRQWAMNLIQDYIAEEFADEMVIMVGDMNDEISDPEAQNVFMDFIDDPANYLFADIDIAEDNTHREWSYPSWPSHLDHILITNELFDAFGADDAQINTIRIDDYLNGGWGVYDAYISDHRPVAIKLPL